MPVEQLTARDGVVLAVEHDEVPSARAHVVIVHGYLEHRGRYSSLVERLVAEGIACHRFDLRGHGESEGVRGHVGRFADYLDDLDAVTALVRGRTGATSLLLIGHSLGGLIALAYVRRHSASYAGVALSSPFLRRAFVVSAAQRFFAEIGSRIVPRLSIRSTLDAAWISRDPDIVRAYANDPRVLATTTPRWFTEVAAAQADLVTHAHEIDVPALFLVGDADRIADHRVALDVFERLGTPASEKRLRVCAQSYHEVFNELAATRDEAIRNLISWILERSAATPVH